jgi:hypothetical protein
LHIGRIEHRLPISRRIRDAAPIRVSPTQSILLNGVPPSSVHPNNFPFV